MNENKEYVSRSDELGNIHISEEVLSAIAAAAAMEEKRTAANDHQCEDCHNGDGFFVFTEVKFHCFGLRFRRSAARRPKCDRFCWRSQRWTVRG